MCKSTKPTHETDYGYNLTTVANNSFGLRTKSQTFLKEEKVFGKVHQGREAEGNQSLHLLLQTSYLGLKELGYPNERHTLVSWYRGYEEKGEVKDEGREEKKLSHVYSMN